MRTNCKRCNQYFGMWKHVIIELVTKHTLAISMKSNVNGYTETHNSYNYCGGGGRPHKSMILLWWYRIGTIFFKASNVAFNVFTNNAST